MDRVTLPDRCQRHQTRQGTPRLELCRQLRLDLMQLVNDGVVMYDTMKDRRIGIPEVIEQWRDTFGN